MKTKHNRQTAAPDTRLQELTAELDQTREELALAYRQFDMAADPELVESCIYQIKALKARYNYLIRTVKDHRSDAVAAASGKGGRWV